MKDAQRVNQIFGQKTSRAEALQIENDLKSDDKEIQQLAAVRKIVGGIYNKQETLAHLKQLQQQTNNRYAGLLSNRSKVI